MNQVKLEDLRCGHCKKIPTPGDKIYSCSLCPRNKRYRCEACISPSLFHRLEPHHHGLNFFQSPSFSTMRFEPILTKLVLENFTPRREYFCSSSKNGKIHPGRIPCSKSPWEILYLPGCSMSICGLQWRHCLKRCWQSYGKSTQDVESWRALAFFWNWKRFGWNHLLFVKLWSKILSTSVCQG